MPIRTILVDDHAILRRGLRRILESHTEISVVGESDSGDGAVELAAQVQPDVAVVDIALKQMNGINATAQIRIRSPKTAVLILSMYDDEQYVRSAITAGAQGYLVKDSVEEELIGAIEAVHRGEKFFSPLVHSILAHDVRWGRPPGMHLDRYELLTSREREVFKLLAGGAANKEVAALLSLSIHTVETHRNRIMEKLGLHSAAELVLSAVRRGIVH